MQGLHHHVAEILALDNLILWQKPSSFLSCLYIYIVFDKYLFFEHLAWCTIFLDSNCILFFYEDPRICRMCQKICEY